MKYLFFTSVAYLLFPISLLSSSFASPISPGKPEKDNILGVLLGFGQNIQSGSLLVDCKECEFNDGLGVGYTFGFTYQKGVALADDSPFWSSFFYGAMLHLSNKNISSSYKEIRTQHFADYDISFPIMFRQKSETTIMTAGLMPYISYQPIKHLFFRFGVDGSVVFNENIKHSMELLDRKKTLPSGEVVDIYIPVGNANRKTYSVVLQDSPLEDINRFQLNFVPMFGGNIYFSDKFICSPSFSYHIPLQKLTSSGDLSVSAWRLNFEFRYNLATSNKIYKSKEKPRVVRRK